MDRIPPEGTNYPFQGVSNQSGNDNTKQGSYKEESVKKEAGVKTIDSDGRPGFEGKSLLECDVRRRNVESQTSVDSEFGSESDIDSEFSATEADLKQNDKFLFAVKELEAMAEKLLVPDKDFETASFLSGYGKQQQLQVDQLCQEIIDKFYDGSRHSLVELLEKIKYKDDSRGVEEPVKHSFFLRCALLLASEKSGAGIESWEVFTRTIPLKAEGKGFWSWLEQLNSWIPEAQGAVAKYMEHSWINALELARQHPAQQVVAYKGGFGAGKTSHGKVEFGENFRGSIAPDTAKKVIRKALPVSHSTAHTQGSDMAFRLFDWLIKKPMGQQFMIALCLLPMT